MPQDAGAATIRLCPHRSGSSRGRGTPTTGGWSIGPAGRCAIRDGSLPCSNVQKPTDASPGASCPPLPDARLAARRRRRGPDTLLRAWRAQPNFRGRSSLLTETRRRHPVGAIEVDSQRRPSCGYSPTTASSPASPWRRAGPSCRRRSQKASERVEVPRSGRLAAIECATGGLT
jgi:hypothetical protein